MYFLYLQCFADGGDVAFAARAKNNNQDRFKLVRVDAIVAVLVCAVAICRILFIYLLVRTIDWCKLRQKTLCSCRQKICQN